MCFLNFDKTKQCANVRHGLPSTNLHNGQADIQHDNDENVSVACNVLSRNGHALYYHLALSGHNFTLALITVLKRMLNQRSLVALSVGINNPE